MYELLTRQVPYEALSPWKLRDTVLGGGRPAVPAHPALSPLFVTLMQACWAAEPESRPRFRAIPDELLLCKRSS